MNEPTRVARSDYEAKLFELEEMTDSDAIEAVTRLNENDRKALASGPIARRWSCRVCECLKDKSQDEVQWLVFGYHEVPKIDMRTKNDQWYGPHADETWRRCQVIYEAAGWKRPYPPLWIGELTGEQQSKCATSRDVRLDRQQ